MSENEEAITGLPVKDEKIDDQQHQIELLEEALSESEQAARDTHNMLVRTYRAIGSLKLPMAAFEEIMPIYRELQEFLKEEE